MITKFRKYEVLDSQLPLSEALSKRIAGDFGIPFARDHRQHFLPYTFLRDMRDYHRHSSDSERVLPFIGEPEFVVSGGFGDLSKVTIFGIRT